MYLIGCSIFFDSPFNHCSYDYKFQVSCSTHQDMQAQNWECELHTTGQTGSQDQQGLNARRGLGHLKMVPVRHPMARSNLTDSLIPALDTFALKRTYPPRSEKPSEEDLYF